MEMTPVKNDANWLHKNNLHIFHCGNYNSNLQMEPIFLIDSMISIIDSQVMMYHCQASTRSVLLAVCNLYSVVLVYEKNYFNERRNLLTTHQTFFDFFLSFLLVFCFNQTTTSVRK